MDWLQDFLRHIPFLPIILALLTGGVIVKVIEIWASRSGRLEDVRYTERNNLRKDITYLRQEVTKLRTEVNELRTAIDKKDQVIDEWQRKYWTQEARIAKVIAYYKEHASTETRTMLDAYIQDLEKGAN